MKIYALLFFTALCTAQPTFSFDLYRSWNKKVALAAVTAVSYATHKAYQYIARKAHQGQKKCALQEKALSLKAPTITLFSHGVGESHKSGHYYKRHNFIKTPVHTFDYPDSTKCNPRQPANLGQNIDINCLADEYQKAVKAGKKVILYGVSRGAATILNFMGTHHTQNVQAIIVESPFDHVESVVDNLLGTYLNWIPGLTTMGTLACRLVHRNYSPYGIHPHDVIHKIQKDIPILIICSKQDALIPYTSTVKLYRTLIKLGYTKVHVLITDHGEHARIITGAEGMRYCHDVHAFLRHYGLPHDPALAQKSKHKDFRRSTHKKTVSMVKRAPVKKKPKKV